MRLLKILPGGGYGFETFDDDEPPPYAILSHRWGAEEVLYENILDGTAKTMLGYVKLEFCGERAEVDSILYFWSDTCCINKADAGETQRSINSMYKWYQRAAKCYVYLSDVSAPDKDAEARQSTWLEDFRKSTWFTRGWTLQELLAPDIVEFFSIERNWLGDRVSLIDEICEITELPVKLLRGHDPADWSLDERLNWTAKRTTTVKEDIIYCLLGLCGVFLSIIQGEGADYAEERLRDEFERRQRGRGVRNLHDLPGMFVNDEASKSRRLRATANQTQCLCDCPFHEMSFMLGERLNSTCSSRLWCPKVPPTPTNASQYMVWVVVGSQPLL
jgi:hypothetical protein